MSLKKDPQGGGTELDGSKSSMYCSRCYAGGAFTASDMTVGQMQELVKGNLDFVVVGPPGVFLVEVKSHGGKIDFDGYGLTLNGRSFTDKDFLRQVHGQMWALRKYLEASLGAAPYIHSVMVFSSRYASLHFGYKPVNNVYIVQKDFLLGLFDQFPKYNFAVARERIEDIFLKATNKK